MAKNIVGSSYIELLIDGKKIRGEVLKEGKVLGQQAGSEFSKSFNNAINVAGLTAVAYSIKNIGQQVFTLASQVQQAKISFEQMTGSAEIATKLLSDIQSFAKSTPFDQLGLVDGAKRLMAYGFEAQQIIPIMNSLGNAVAAVGGGNAQETLNGVIVALGQMQTKGKLVQQEVNQIAERGIPIFDILREKLGLTQEQLGDIGTQGISAAEAIPAILEGINERFDGLMEKQATTLAGRWSNLVDVAKISMSEIGLNSSNIIGDMILDISDYIQSNQDMLVQFGSDVTGTIVTTTQGIVEILTFALEGWTGLLSKMVEVTEESFDGMEKSSSDLNNAMSGDISDIAYIFRLAITSIVGAIRIAGSVFGGTVDFMVGASEQGGSYISNAFSYAWESIKLGAKSVGGNVVNYFVDMFNKASNKINEFTSLVNTALPNSMKIGKIGNLDGINLDFDTSGIEKSKNFLKNSAQSFKDIYKNSFEGVENEVNNLMDSYGEIYQGKLESMSKKEQKIENEKQKELIKNEYNSYLKRKENGDKFSKSEIERMERYGDYIKNSEVNTSLDGLFGNILDIQKELDKGSKGSTETIQKEIEKQISIIKEKLKTEIEVINKSTLSEYEKAKRIVNINEEAQRQIQELEGKTSDLAVKDAKELVKAHEDKTNKLKKYGEELIKIGDKFSDMKDKLLDDIRSINNELGALDINLQEDLAKRFIDVEKSLDGYQRQINQDGASLSYEDIEEFNKLQEERIFLLANTTEEARKQAQAYNDLTESEKTLLKYQQDRAVLEEKKAIAESFNNQDSLLQNALTIDPETNKVFYENEKGELVAITNLKNEEYARDLINKQVAMQQELTLKQQEIANFINEEEKLYSKKKELLKSFTNDVESSTNLQKKNISGLIDMFQKAIQGYKQYQAVMASGGVSGGRAFGGSIMPNMLYKFQENGLQEYISSPAYSRVQPAPASSYKTQNITVNNQNHMRSFGSGEDFGDWISHNIGHYL